MRLKNNSAFLAAVPKESVDGACLLGIFKKTQILEPHTGGKHL